MVLLTFEKEPLLFLQKTCLCMWILKVAEVETFAGKERELAKPASFAEKTESQKPANNVDR